MDLPSEVIDHLDNNECVYKLSSCVKTSCGVGIIAMTQKRLFLLPQGRPGFLEITKFRDIQVGRRAGVLIPIPRGVRMDPQYLRVPAGGETGPGSLPPRPHPVASHPDLQHDQSV